MTRSPTTDSPFPNDAAMPVTGVQFPVLFRSGAVEVRFATTEAEVEAAQSLRYRVFYEEMGAISSPEVAVLGRDCDRFDSDADHLLVVDRDCEDKVVGTYRIMHRKPAEPNGGFYTAQEFDISKLLAHPGKIVELGRSCVDVGHRTRKVMQLMWKGIAAYIFHYRIELMFGCASLPGVDVGKHAMALSYLNENHRAPQDLCPRAHGRHFTPMNIVAPEKIDARQVLNGLPPLIRGYLRLGGWVGDGAVIDQQFNTTDICVVVRTASVTERYYKHYVRTVGGAALQ